MNDVFTYQLPDDVPNRLIGEYDQNTGDNPHDLRAFGFSKQWNAPDIKFEVSADRIDAIPETNLPVQLLHRRICDQIMALAPNDVVAIDTPVIANGKRVENYAILYPLHCAAVWDLELSDWSGLAMDSWPKDSPMYLRKMVMKNSIETFTIACNEHWHAMLLFDARVATIIRKESSWAKIISPEDFRNA